MTTRFVDLTRNAAREAVQWYFAPVAALTRRYFKSTSEVPAPQQIPPSTAEPLMASVAAESGARRWQIEISSAFQESANEIHLSSDAVETVMMLVIQLTREADSVSPIPGTEVRVLSSRRRLVASDGRELAPLAVFYTIDAGESAVRILDVRTLETVEDANFVHAAAKLAQQSRGDTLAEVIEAARTAA